MNLTMKYGPLFNGPQCSELQFSAQFIYRFGVAAPAVHINCKLRAAVSLVGQVFNIIMIVYTVYFFFRVFALRCTCILLTQCTYFVHWHVTFYSANTFLLLRSSSSLIILFRWSSNFTSSDPNQIGKKYTKITELQ